MTMMMTTIQVAIRVRPSSDWERSESEDVVTAEASMVSVQEAGLSEGGLLRRIRAREYAFDYCFGPKSSQEELFTSLSPILLNSFESNRNASVIAYGQTGSGKTFTMLGDTLYPGLIPRICEACISHTSDSGSEHFEVSFYEIYNDKVRDLLSAYLQTTSSRITKLRIREHPTLGPYIQGLGWHCLDSPSDLAEILNVGCLARSSSATAFHSASSRSHAIFTIRRRSSVAKLNFVDLAGSERHHISGTKEQIRETAYINKSLATLGSVILALSSRTGRRATRHIPYRDSTLTWLLKDSIGGNSKTIMIGTISPTSKCRSETLNTLRYAHKARHIVNRSSMFDQNSFHGVGDPHSIISDLKAEIARLRAIINDGGPQQRPPIPQVIVEAAYIGLDTTSWDFSQQQVSSKVSRGVMTSPIRSSDDEGSIDLEQALRSPKTLVNGHRNEEWFRHNQALNSLIIPPPIRARPALSSADKYDDFWHDPFLNQRPSVEEREIQTESGIDEEGGEPLDSDAKVLVDQVMNSVVNEYKGSQKHQPNMLTDTEDDSADGISGHPNGSTSLNRSLSNSQFPRNGLLQTATEMNTSGSWTTHDLSTEPIDSLFLSPALSRREKLGTSIGGVNGFDDEQTDEEGENKTDLQGLAKKAASSAVVDRVEEGNWTKEKETVTSANTPSNGIQSASLITPDISEKAIPHAKLSMEEPDESDRSKPSTAWTDGIASISADHAAFAGGNAPVKSSNPATNTESHQPNGIAEEIKPSDITSQHLQTFNSTNQFEVIPSEHIEALKTHDEAHSDLDDFFDQDQSQKLFDSTAVYKYHFDTLESSTTSTLFAQSTSGTMQSSGSSQLKSTPSSLIPDDAFKQNLKLQLLEEIEGQSPGHSPSREGARSADGRRSTSGERVRSAKKVVRARAELRLLRRDSRSSASEVEDLEDTLEGQSASKMYGGLMTGGTVRIATSAKPKGTPERSHDSRAKSRKTDESVGEMRVADDDDSDWPSYNGDSFESDHDGGESKRKAQGDEEDGGENLLLQSSIISANQLAQFKLNAKRDEKQQDDADSIAEELPSEHEEIEDTHQPEATNTVGPAFSADSLLSELSPVANEWTPKQSPKGSPKLSDVEQHQGDLLEHTMQVIDDGLVAVSATIFDVDQTPYDSKVVKADEDEFWSPAKNYDATKDVEDTESIPEVLEGVEVEIEGSKEAIKAVNPFGVVTDHVITHYPKHQIPFDSASEDDHRAAQGYQTLSYTDDHLQDAINSTLDQSTVEAHGDLEEPQTVETDRISQAFSNQTHQLTEAVHMQSPHKTTETVHETNSGPVQSKMYSAFGTDDDEGSEPDNRQHYSVSSQSIESQSSDSMLAVKGNAGKQSLNPFDDDFAPDHTKEVLNLELREDGLDDLNARRQGFTNFGRQQSKDYSVFERQQSATSFNGQPVDLEGSAQEASKPSEVEVAEHFASSLDNDARLQQSISLDQLNRSHMIDPDHLIGVEVKPTDISWAKFDAEPKTPLDTQNMETTAAPLDEEKSSFGHSVSSFVDRLFYGTGSHDPVDYYSRPFEEPKEILILRFTDDDLIESQSMGQPASGVWSEEAQSVRHSERADLDLEPSQSHRLMAPGSNQHTDHEDDEKSSLGHSISSFVDRLISRSDSVDYYHLPYEEPKEVLILKLTNDGLTESGQFEDDSWTNQRHTGQSSHLDESRDGQEPQIVGTGSRSVSINDGKTSLSHSVSHIIDRLISRSDSIDYYNLPYEEPKDIQSLHRWNDGLMEPYTWDRPVSSAKSTPIDQDHGLSDPNEFILHSRPWKGDDPSHVIQESHEEWSTKLFERSSSLRHEYREHVQDRHEVSMDESQLHKAIQQYEVSDQPKQDVANESKGEQVSLGTADPHAYLDHKLLQLKSQESESNQEDFGNQRLDSKVEQLESLTTSHAPPQEKLTMKEFLQSMFSEEDDTSAQVANVQVLNLDHDGLTDLPDQEPDSIGGQKTPETPRESKHLTTDDYKVEEDIAEEVHAEQAMDEASDDDEDDGPDVHYMDFLKNEKPPQKRASLLDINVKSFDESKMVERRGSTEEIDSAPKIAPPIKKAHSVIETAADRENEFGQAEPHGDEESSQKLIMPLNRGQEVHQEESNEQAEPLSPFSQFMSLMENLPEGLYSIQEEDEANTPGPAIVHTRPYIPPLQLDTDDDSMHVLKLEQDGLSTFEEHSKPHQVKDAFENSDTSSRESFSDFVDNKNPLLLSKTSSLGAHDWSEEISEHDPAITRGIAEQRQRAASTDEDNNDELVDLDASMNQSHTNLQPNIDALLDSFSSTKGSLRDSLNSKPPLSPMVSSKGNLDTPSESPRSPKDLSTNTQSYVTCNSDFLESSSDMILASPSKEAKVVQFIRRGSEVILDSDEEAKPMGESNGLEDIIQAKIIEHQDGEQRRFSNDFEPTEAKDPKSTIHDAKGEGFASASKGEERNHDGERPEVHPASPDDRDSHVSKDFTGDNRRRTSTDHNDEDDQEHPTDDKEPPCIEKRIGDIEPPCVQKHVPLCYCDDSTDEKCMVCKPWLLVQEITGLDENLVIPEDQTASAVLDTNWWKSASAPDHEDLAPNLNPKKVDIMDDDFFSNEELRVARETAGPHVGEESKHDPWASGHVEQELTSGEGEKEEWTAGIKGGDNSQGAPDGNEEAEATSKVMWSPPSVTASSAHSHVDADALPKTLQEEENRPISSHESDENHQHHHLQLEPQESTNSIGDFEFDLMRPASPKAQKEPMVSYAESVESHDEPEDHNALHQESSVSLVNLYEAADHLDQVHATSPKHRTGADQLEASSPDKATSKINGLKYSLKSQSIEECLYSPDAMNQTRFDHSTHTSPIIQTPISDRLIPLESPQTKMVEFSSAIVSPPRQIPVAVGGGSGRMYANMSDDEHSEHPEQHSSDEAQSPRSNDMKPHEAPFCFGGSTIQGLGQTVSHSDPDQNLAESSNPLLSVNTNSDHSQSNIASIFSPMEDVLKVTVVDGVPHLSLSTKRESERQTSKSEEDDEEEEESQKKKHPKKTKEAEWARMEMAERTVANGRVPRAESESDASSVDEDVNGNIAMEDFEKKRHKASFSNDDNQNQRPQPEAHGHETLHRTAETDAPNHDRMDAYLGIHDHSPNHATTDQSSDVTHHGPISETNVHWPSSTEENILLTPSPSPTDAYVRSLERRPFAEINHHNIEGHASPSSNSHMQQFEHAGSSHQKQQEQHQTQVESNLKLHDDPSDHNDIDARLFELTSDEEHDRGSYPEQIVEFHDITRLPDHQSHVQDFESDDDDDFTDAVKHDLPKDLVQPRSNFVYAARSSEEQDDDGTDIDDLVLEEGNHEDSTTTTGKLKSSGYSYNEYEDDADIKAYTINLNSDEDEQQGEGDRGNMAGEHGRSRDSELEHQQDSSPDGSPNSQARKSVSWSDLERGKPLEQGPTVNRGSPSTLKPIIKTKTSPRSDDGSPTESDDAHALTSPQPPPRPPRPTTLFNRPPMSLQDSITVAKRHAYVGHSPQALVDEGVQTETPSPNGYMRTNTVTSPFPEEPNGAAAAAAAAAIRTPTVDRRPRSPTSVESLENLNTYNSQVLLGDLMALVHERDTVIEALEVFVTSSSSPALQQYTSYSSQRYIHEYADRLKSTKAELDQRIDELVGHLRVLFLDRKLAESLSWLFSRHSTNLTFKNPPSKMIEQMSALAPFRGISAPPSFAASSSAGVGTTLMPATATGAYAFSSFTKFDNSISRGLSRCPRLHLSPLDYRQKLLELRKTLVQTCTDLATAYADSIIYDTFSNAALSGRSEPNGLGGSSKSGGDLGFYQRMFADTSFDTQSPIRSRPAVQQQHGVQYPRASDSGYGQSWLPGVSAADSVHTEGMTNDFIGSSLLNEIRELRQVSREAINSGKDALRSSGMPFNRPAVRPPVEQSIGYGDGFGQSARPKSMTAEDTKIDAEIASLLRMYRQKLVGLDKSNHHNQFGTSGF